MVGKKMVGAKSAVYMIYEFHFGFFLVLRFQAKGWKVDDKRIMKWKKKRNEKKRMNEWQKRNEITDTTMGMLFNWYRMKLSIFSSIILQ